MIRVKLGPDVVRLNTAIQVEGGSVLRFSSIGTASTFIHRNGGEIIDQPKPKRKAKRVDNVDNQPDSSAESGTGDGGKGKAKAATGIK